MEAKTNQSGADCFEISLILRKIFDYFTTTELLELSVVSKVWNFEARIVMKNREDLTATLGENQPCKDLVALASDLQRMNVVPVCGMSICFNTRCHVDDKSQRSALSAISTILDRVRWKNLSVRLRNYMKVRDDCPAMVLAKKVLECHCETLEELAIDLKYDQGESFRQVIQDGSFPRLKTLKIGTLPRPYCMAYSRFIKMLISRAPNLKEVFSAEAMDFTENILKGSSAVMYVAKKFSPSYWEYPEIFRALRLNELVLEYFREDYSPREFRMHIPTLLESSRCTLTSLTIDLMIALPIMSYRICLENVIELTLVMNQCNTELVEPFLNAFNFKRIFPILNTVQISCRQYRHPISEELVGDFIEQAQAVLMDPPALDRATNIKHIHICRPMENSGDFAFFAGVFPDVEIISLRERNHPEILKGPIFENWKGLKELQIITDLDYPHLPQIQNLDSVFCGIFPEEVEELRGKDDEYLKAVHIVPVMPSICCMRDLRTLTLDYIDQLYHLVQDDYCRLGDEMGYVPTFIFSKVAGLVAFARCENLSVTLRTNILEICEGLEHMYPYVSVFHEPCDIIDTQLAAY